MNLIAKSSMFLLLASGIAFAQFPSQLKNVIVIVQENRTPDNLFHFLTPACPIPAGATGYAACTPSPVTNHCYDISPCGLSNQSGTVVPVPLQPVGMDNGIDPGHGYINFQQMCDPDPKAGFKCRMDGAWHTFKNGLSYGYADNPAVTNYDGSAGHYLDPYLTFAKQYGWANFMYQTNQSASYPAHQFLFSGTSALTNLDDAYSIFVSEIFYGAPILKAGCVLPPSTTANSVFGYVIQPTTGTSTECTLYDNRSVQECKVYNNVDANNVGTFCGDPNNMATTVLEPNSISWKYYAPSAFPIWQAPNAIRSICNPQPDGTGAYMCTGEEWTNHVDLSDYGTDILRDIRDCKLAQVSWAIPNGTWSDHPMGDYYQSGPSWVAAIINLIANNPPCPAGTPDAGQTYWDNTVVVVTWDDWGGWSDNQPPVVAAGLPCVYTTPPTACRGDFEYGFRVPLLIVSAYTPRGYIDNVTHDFGSILRMIEGINHVPEGMMKNADARSATDLHGFFTLTQPRQYQTVPAAEDVDYFLTFKGAVAVPDND